MTRYTVTAWCERPFFAQCEVEAESPEEALTKARIAVHDAPAEECDEGYYWDEWRVDTEEADGVLLHLDEPAGLRAAAPKLLAACDLVQRAHVGDGVTMAEAVDTCLLAIAEATKGAPSQQAADPHEALLLASAYIQYVKERNPGLHGEADGSPSIDQAVTQAIGRAA